MHQQKFYELYPELIPIFEKIKLQKEKEAIDISQGLFIQDMPVYNIHLFLFSLMDRTVNLLDAILDAFEKWNVIVVGSLLRNLLENAFLLVYIGNIENSPEVVERFINDGRIMKFDNGKWKLVQEREIVDFAEKFFPFKKVYSDLSRFVHFSKTHILSTFNFDSIVVENKRRFTAKIGVGYNMVSKHELMGYLDATYSITSLIFRYTKENIKIINSHSLKNS